MATTSLCIAIPVFNEAAQLALSIRRLNDFLDGTGWSNVEVVVVDNGSKDDTWYVAQRLCAEYGRLRTMRIEAKGRGRALKAVWAHSHADVLAYMDVDLSTDLTDLPRLIEAIAGGGYEIAIGSRLLPESKTTRGWFRESLSQGYNVLVRHMLRTCLSDAQCGFKALNKTAADGLLPLVNDDHWFFDTELLFWAERLGLRIHEIPVHWVDDPDSRVKICRTILDDLRGLIRLRRIMTRMEDKQPTLRSRRSLGKLSND